jgi:preprotein translocase subunit Sss1
MENNNLPVQIKKQSNPLWKEILKFSRRKYGLAILLLFIGLLGFLIPVIPGVLLIIFAVALVKPGMMQKLRAKMNSIFKNDRGDKKKGP